MRTADAKYVCPTCGHRVATIAERHKTMGVAFPVWVPGPCHNPECPDRVPEWVHTDPRRHAGRR
ncbi:MAG TPA: hypothetical protein VLH10_13245 [Yinghuangia sp.]|uniref:hypothetical protein n=1 Tax=Yinghuangia sp. YIM S10712 TaxID=3436930 RepID=UPI002D168AAA|nr:hypothetical protein [Yinghuangia sp.]